MRRRMLILAKERRVTGMGKIIAVWRERSPFSERSLFLKPRSAARGPYSHDDLRIKQGPLRWDCAYGQFPNLKFPLAALRGFRKKPIADCSVSEQIRHFHKKQPAIVEEGAART